MLATSDRARLRIALALHDLSAGGTERVALLLAGEWAKAADVHLLLGSAAGPLAVPEGIEVHRLQPELPRAPGSRARFALRLPDLVDRLAPDILFLPGNWHLPLALGLLCSRTRPRVVAKISNPPLPGPSLVRPFARLVFGVLSRPVSRYVAWPPAIAREVRALAPQTPVSEIANPPVVVNPTPPPSAPGRPDRLFAAGRLVPQKDMGLAIAALERAVRHRPLRLEIAGEGPERARLEARARGLPVAFLGHVPDIRRHLTGAGALLLTSRYEGTPAVVLEALAHGVPVIATDCAPFVRDLIEAHPDRGRLVRDRRPEAVADALLDRLADPRPVADISALLEAHQPARVASAWLDLFRVQLRQAA